MGIPVFICYRLQASQLARYPGATAYAQQAWKLTCFMDDLHFPVVKASLPPSFHPAQQPCNWSLPISNQKIFLCQRSTSDAQKDF